MWTGHQVHEGADAARAAVPGDNFVSRGVRHQITATETDARFAVGAVGGLANEAVGLVGSVGELGVTATELQVSPAARAELGQKIVGLAEQGGAAVRDYAGKVAADPTRLLTDPGNLEIAAGKAAWGFVKGQYNEVRTAAANGQGPETLGFKTGQVASYLIPVGGGPARGALTAGVEATTRAGLETGARVTTEAAARGTTEALARSGTEAVARDTAGAGARLAGAETRVVELAATPAARHAAEKTGADLVARADAAGGSIRVAPSGGITAQDLAAATRASGREVALYRDAASGERYLAVGTKTGVEVPQGAKLIAHTQPGIGADAVRASVADEAALSRLGQRSSVIIDEGGTAATRFRATGKGAAAARSEGAITLNAPRASGRLAVDVAAEQAAINSQKFADLAASRVRRSLPPAGSANDVSTLAKLEIDGFSFEDINSAMQQPRTAISLERVNAQTVTHAEAEVVQKALDAGKRHQAVGLRCGWTVLRAPRAAQMVACVLWPAI